MTLAPLSSPLSSFSVLRTLYFFPSTAEEEETNYVNMSPKKGKRRKRKRETADFCLHIIFGMLPPSLRSVEDMMRPPSVRPSASGIMAFTHGSSRMHLYY